MDVEIRTERLESAIGMDPLVQPKRVSIVIPVYNEKKVLEALLSRIQKAFVPLSGRYRLEILFIDDGSTDGSAQLAKALALKEPRLKVLELRRNYGQTAALQAGLDHARGDIVITMDADLQHFPEEIPHFIEKIEAGFDVVCGWRHDRQEGIIRRWPSRAANLLIRKCSGLQIHDIGTTFRAYRSEIVHDIRLLGENHRFIPVFAKSAGARITEIKIQNIERPVGASNYGISRTLNVFVDIFFLYFYTKYFDRPMRVFGKLGLLSFSGASLISVVLLAYTFITGVGAVRNRVGWFALALILFVTSVQLILTGILAEIIVRIYYASGKHASYQVRSASNLLEEQGT